jgi:hypothetical protein
MNNNRRRVRMLLWITLILGLISVATAVMALLG